MLIENINTGFNSTYYQERVLFSTVEMPDYANFRDDIPILISYPQWLKMTDMSLNQTAAYWLWININDPDDHALIDEIYDAFEEEFGVSSEI